MVEIEQNLQLTDVYSISISVVNLHRFKYCNRIRRQDITLIVNVNLSVITDWICCQFVVHWIVYLLKYMKKYVFSK